MFQHTAARRRLLANEVIDITGGRFNTQPRGGGCAIKYIFNDTTDVSTHSRAEAAALQKGSKICVTGFQHTAARRRLQQRIENISMG